MLIYLFQRIHNQLKKKSNVETLSDTGRKTQSGRPVYTNQDGDFVTERTATVESEKLGGYVNIPTVYDGRFVSEQEALRIVEGADGKDPVTGQKLKVYRNVDTAVKDAVSKSNNLGRELSN
ncbi:hypothetical protein N9459_04255 [Flavobacteriaceae bacterium]|nr:hypothetical protein [Flavobacteriaceae bacterium]